MLNITSFGTASGLPTLLIAHGLFGSARNWGAIARRMADDRRVVAVDMRNHGESFRAETNSYQDLANDLAEVISAENAAVDVIGHSMGGKASMLLALMHPDQVNRLIVGDISPVKYSHTQGHLTRAMRELDLDGITSRGEADRRLALRVDDPGVRAFLLQSLDLKEQYPRWRLNLEVLEREMPQIMGWPVIDSEYAGPVLMLAGGLSDYVKTEHRAEIKRLFPNAKFAKIPGAGHWLHADKPREFEATLRSFFN
ncbi:MAG: alpha/beta fold hydrolase [Paracoccaceae bacterium]|nr:alpha/beta fold hydrolase [Paracoccaceae bacterium]MDH5529939.1 alpha/beta fold hydrolase [Paracoccaceae bacterium]